MPPPPTLFRCIISETLAIAPQSQKHVCQILWLARFLLLQSSRMSPFRRPVSAAKNSVPDSSFGDGFDPCVGSRQFDPDRLHHPVLPNRRSPGRLQRGRFCGDFRRYHSALSVSGDTCGLSGRFLASRLCIKKFRSPRQGFDGQCRSAAGHFWSLVRPKAPFRAGP